MKPYDLFNKKLYELIQECIKGQIHYRLWKRLNESFGKEKNTIELFPLFFQFTAEAHFNCTRLHLFRIIDDTKGANSIKALIEFAEKHPEFFSSEIRFEEVIQRHKKLLKEAKPKIDILLKQRHKHFIHKSNEYLVIGYDNLYKEYKSSYVDYFELLESIDRMLNEYLDILKGESYFVIVKNEQQEFDALINSLKKGTEIIEKTKLSKEQIQQNSKNLLRILNAKRKA